MRDLLATALDQAERPFAIRYPKAPCVRFTPSRPGRVLPIGSWEVLREGEGICLLAVGSMVEACEKAAVLLEEKGVRPGVANCRFVKPLDRDLLRRLRSRYSVLATVEENVVSGGFGSAVHEALVEMDLGGGPLAHLAVPDRFVTHGSRGELLEEVGLTPPRIASRILELAGVEE